MQNTHELEIKWAKLPEFEPHQQTLEKDWLLDPSHAKAGVFRTNNKGEICLTNGLISRTIKITPNGCTIGFDNLMMGDPMIRGVKPEAKLTINEKEYSVGGLYGQVEYGYLLPEWIPNFTIDPKDFILTDFSFGEIKERFGWKQKRYASNKTWPPKGMELILIFQHPELEGIIIGVHYEIYDRIPLLAKWLTIDNKSSKSIILNKFTSEILALVEADCVPQGDANKDIAQPLIHVESDYIFAAMAPKTADVTTHWVDDPQYTSQVAYLSNSKVQLESRPPIGPEQEIAVGHTFESYRTYELIFDSTDRERQGLAQRKMYRTLAPWITENPIFMHMITADPMKVKPVIDQCAELGFEMVILSFGCGIDMEWEDPDFYEEFKELFDYAHSKGIEIGTYSLFSSRTINKETDVIDPETMEPSTKAVFGKAPCLMSQWGINYLEKLKKFIVETGADFIEHDGPYPGDLCASTHHPGHKGIKDSQWTQWKAQADFYKWCCANGIFINAPDWYFLSGSNKTGMGYKEVNWSLPRDRQIILGRQNIFDGTWEKAPSMGWMFTPLSVYHAVGEWEKSTLVPLKDHLKEYEAHLAQNFGSGVQSCYRGPMLYDTDETKALVKKWVDFYRQYREILDSDIIHWRRPNGRDIDGILHVNPHLKHKGLAIFYNPLKISAKRTVKLPLYYTGLTETAIISKEGQNSQSLKLDRQYNIEFDVEIPAESRTWYLIE